LAELCAAIDEAKLPVTVRPVDDGSGEAESKLLSETVERLKADHPCLDDPILLPENRGKGGAIYAGWDSAEEEDFGWLAFVDADGAVSSKETVRFLATTSSSPAADRACLFAVRTRDAGTEVRRTPLRKILGNVFRLLVRATVRLPLRDTQCGLKAVPADCYRNVRQQLQERRFIFDVELAAYLLRSGCTLREFPISWEESPGSTLGVLSAAHMLVALIGLRCRLAATA
jgi:glycosyltransferase involved in cell wall biosynthesis